METLSKQSSNHILDPITPESINCKLTQFKQASPLEIIEWDKSIPLKTARLHSWCDITEATANLELSNLDFNNSLSSESTHKLRISLEEEIENVKAIRQLNTIFVNLNTAASVWARAALKAAEATAVLKEFTDRRTALDAELSPLLARDVDGELAGIETIHDEIRWLSLVLKEGHWKQVSLDFRAAHLAEELQQLISNNRYEGEPTKDAAEARILELETKIALIDERETNNLSHSERRRLKIIQSEITDVTGHIARETEASEMLSAVASEHKSIYDEALEIAEISGSSINDVYQINCRRFRVAVNVA